MSTRIGVEHCVVYAYGDHFSKIKNLKQGARVRLHCRLYKSLPGQQVKGLEY